MKMKVDGLRVGEPCKAVPIGSSMIGLGEARARALPGGRLKG